MLLRSELKTGNWEVLKMGVKEWAEENIELIKRIAFLEEIGFSVTMNHYEDCIELIVRRRK